MKSKTILVCLVGLPGAGKTTLSSALVSKPFKCYSVDYICYDQHIPRVNHHEDPTAWSKARQAVNQKIIEIVQQNHPSITNRMLLLDDNFYYRGMRKEIYHIAQRNGCVFGQIVFPISQELSISTNALRSESIVTPDTIRRMSSSIEYPSEAWEKHVLVLDKIDYFNESTLEKRFSKVEGFLRKLNEESIEFNPQDEIHSKEKERIKTSQDAMQQCGIIIRREITERIKEDTLSKKMIPYKFYGDAKAALLDRLKKEYVEVLQGKSYKELESIVVEQFDELIRQISRS